MLLTAAALEAQVLNLQDNVALTAGVEQIVFQAKAGADQITVSTLAASTVQKVTIDLRLFPTSTTTDLAVDAITVNCTNDADNVTITGGAGSATVSGLAPAVIILGAESARDTLAVNGLAGNDVINASALSGDAIRLTMRGGQGFDTLTGSAGDDVFAWFPGDSNDTTEGGPGNDLLQISGANIAENVAFAANGTRFRFTRDVASVVLDANAVERVSFAALGGADTISFTNLSTTAVRQVSLDLSVPGNTAGDTQPDTIVVTTPPATAISTAVGAGAWIFSWSPVRISVTGVEPAIDRMILQTAAGSNSTISASEEEMAKVWP